MTYVVYYLDNFGDKRMIIIHGCTGRNDAEKSARYILGNKVNIYDIRKQ